VSKRSLIIIAAPSGAGKTTLGKRLLRDLSDQLKLSISTTTRPVRHGETNGKDYYFVSVDEFEKMIEEGNFAEWAKVHDHYYGTSKTSIRDTFELGISLLLDIDVQGADSLLTAYPEDCFRVFIVPPNMEVLEKRLRSRGTDSEEVIRKRIRNATTEMKRADDFDHVIVNDNLDTAYEKLRVLVTNRLKSAE
jgi:guanylate kinase